MQALRMRTAAGEPPGRSRIHQRESSREVSGHRPRR
jgi:hypothetical protein